MAFTCEAKILSGQLRDDSLVFDCWIEEAWSKYVVAGTAFAKAHDRQGNCVLNLTGPGFLTARPKLVAGDRISVGTLVAYFSADGEAIPYGRPYCTISYGSEV